MRPTGEMRPHGRHANSTGEIDTILGITLPSDENNRFCSVKSSFVLLIKNKKQKNLHLS
jgi:hypothetical protein